MSSIWILVGAVSGIIIVVLGAFGAHGLRDILTSNQTIDIYNKAVLYQMFHSITILIVGLLEINLGKTFNLTGILFTSGILIFSGSLYLLAITNMKWLGAITPIGGLCFLAGWVILFLHTINA